jgi:MFS family permease
MVDYGQRVSILATSTTLILLSLASFLSSMVHSTDATLFVYYTENNFAVGPKDIAGLFLALGIAGIIFQAGLLSCLLRCLGERPLLVVSFVSGTLHNSLYCFARSKRTLYLALIASQLTKTNMPILSSLAGAQVSRLDQGRLQGVLSAVNALASALGPPLFMRWSSRSDSSTDDDSSNNQTSHVFGYAALVYGFGVVLVMIVAMIPAEHHDGDEMNHQDRQRQQPEDRATDGGEVESNHRDENNNNCAAEEESSPFVSSTLERPLLLGVE